MTATDTHGMEQRPRNVVQGWIVRMLRELGYSVVRVNVPAVPSTRMVVEPEHQDVLVLIRILEAFTFDSSEVTANGAAPFEKGDVDAILRKHVKRGAVTEQGLAMLACVELLGLSFDEEVLAYQPGEIVGEQRNALVSIMQAAGRADVPTELWGLDRDARLDALIGTCNNLLTAKGGRK